jgi:hypothetical protein
MSHVDECPSCGLPDAYDGDGDGVGSCECSRCDECGAAPLSCRCAELFDDRDDYEWYDATDGRPRIETIQPTGAVL